MGRRVKGYKQVSVGLLPEEILAIDVYLAVTRKPIAQDEPSTGA